ncbi:C-X-C chemokine receptor type 3.1 [Denticeps clupeoides]|uniref:C-X-C chemokine receptor type 3 n=1 Tax=Denticeps clupeoides TaxID=299321 RepID=A0AAY4AJE1_9TELE|nr:C-X-C chemokine receptor type 3-like [Denticeps clupeoides]
MTDFSFSGQKMTFLAEDLMLNYTYSYENDDNQSDTCCSGTVCNWDTSRKFAAVFIPVLYSLALTLGLVGNGLVLAVLWQKRRMWSVTDTFILHLGVADILLLVTLPFWAVEAADEWVFGKGLCKITGAVFKINFYCGIFLLSCISLDRYMSIVHAVQMYSRRKPWMVQASCLGVWIFCVLLSVPDLVLLDTYSEPRKGDKIECIYSFPIDTMSEWRQAFRILYHIVGFLIPATTMVFCYTCILLRLHRGSQSVQKQRAMRVIMGLVVTFFVCWTPYNIVLIMETANTIKSQNQSVECDTYTTLDISLTATTTLGYMHCCLNPVLYAFVGVKFRRHLLELLKSLGCQISRWVAPVSRKSSVWSDSVDTSNTSAF